jgi:hypothetical protein
MKLSPSQRDQYYASLGIQRSDLRSAEPLTLAELPPGVALSVEDRRAVREVLEQWNGMDDPRTRVDAAQAMERIVVAARPGIGSPQAWADYLMLGRVHGCEARCETMGQIARGELVPVPSRPRRPSRRGAAAPQK